MTDTKIDGSVTDRACQWICATSDWSPELRLRVADSLFMNSSEGICITDAQEKIVEVNPTLCQITGFRKEDVLGKTPRIFHSELQDDSYYQVMWRALLQTGQWSGELWNRKPDGELYAVRLSIAAICSERNELTNYMGMMADITKSKLHLSALEKNADHDALTGLPNRVLLADRLQQAMAQALRTKMLLAVCYLDLDGFKAINDNYGHATGDRVLIEVAERLKAAVRVGDTVARIGGDEFVLLLWGLNNTDECQQTVSRVISEVARPVLAEGQISGLTVSVGVAIYPTDSLVPIELLARADSAMYHAKLAGGGQAKSASQADS